MVSDRGLLMVSIRSLRLPSSAREPVAFNVYRKRTRNGSGWIVSDFVVANFI